MPGLGLAITPSGGPFGGGTGLAATNRFIPTRIPNAVLWLQASSNVTTADAAVSQPNDVSNAAWTKTNCTTPDIQTIKDSLDGAPAIHFVKQVATNSQTNHTTTTSYELKAGTKTWAFLQNGNGATGACYVNLSNGTFGNTTGTVSILDVGSGWFRVTIVSFLDTTNDLNIFTANGNGAVSYQGDGNGTILVRNINVDQKNVNTWQDQSGGAKNVTGTGANQPYYIVPAPGSNGSPGIFYDNVNDQLVAATAADWKFLHDNTGSTITWAFKPTSASTQMIASTCAQAPTGIAVDFIAGGAGIQYIYQIYNGAGIILNISDASGVSASVPHVTTCTYGGGSATLRVNGSQKNSASPAGPSASNPTAALTLGGLVGNPAAAPGNGSLLEMIAYNRVLSAIEMTAVETYLRTKYGAP